MDKNKTAITIALLLILTVTLVALPLTNAHDPPWTNKSWTYCDVSPNPVGVNQQALIVFWLDRLPQTAQGAYGDRFTFTLEVTKPDGTTETVGTFGSDPVGGAYAAYVPTSVGEYTFVAKFPGHTYTGEPQPPWGLPSSYQAHINDTLLPSESQPVTLIVQEEQLQPFPITPLPTGYWTRPIDAYNQEWYQIGGNWLGGGHPTDNVNLYTTAPETAHIVWTRPFSDGGILGGEFGETSYYTGSSYETYWRTPLIIQGRFYYDVQTPPREGRYCIDLRTGEELWFQNSTDQPLLERAYGGGGTQGSGGYPTLSFGQVLEYEAPNQHGGFSYLWSTYNDPNNGTTIWQMYDAFTGNWICNINDIPRGGYSISAIDKIGSRLIYLHNSNAGWLALWNSTRAIWYDTLQYAGNNYWTWRPFLGRSFDGANGIQWNVSIPTDIARNGRDDINVVYKDNEPEMLVGTSGLASRYETNAYTEYALSLKEEQEGTVLWRHDYNGPPSGTNTTIENVMPVDMENRVFMHKIKETLDWYGYDLDTGNQIWGPSETMDDFDMYSVRFASVAYGTLYWGNYGGKVWAFNTTTGETLWKTPLESGGLEGPYPYWPIYSSTIADGKIYARTDEHSHTHPIYKGWKMYCIDAMTGEHIWNITGLMAQPLIADGSLVTLNGMDNQIYCFNKGPTSTSVSIQNDVVAYGSDVLIKGMVTDESPGTKESALTARYPNGVPAIADQYQTEWMEHLYKQHEMPTTMEGVEVKLETLDPNGNFYEIGKTISDASGMYSYMFTPEVPGKYTIIATFEGSKAYYSSYAETAVGVSEAPQATVEPTPPPPSTADIYLVPATIGIIIAIVVVGLVIILMLRKR